MKPDIKAVARDGEKYNFHTHTQFCDGHDTVAKMAQAAFEAGFVHIGFTPHAPIPIVSPCNMSMDDVATYIDEVRKADECAAGACHFYAGMEIDYLGTHCNAASSVYGDFGLDFTVSSVHFIPNQAGEYIDIDGRYERFARNMHDHFRDDLRYVVSTFFEQSMQMLSTGHFDILGHFDKIALNGSYHMPGLEQQGWYDDLLQAYISEIISSGVAVEINSKARAEHGRFFPHERLWPQLVNAGVQLIVNSDAHYASRLEAGRTEAFEILRTCPDKK